MSKSGYSVWVGGIEVNDYYLTKEQADRLASLFKMNGHDDVHVRQESDPTQTNDDYPDYIPELDGVYEGDAYDTETLATAKSMHKEDY